jgi:hypothetical protein
VFQDGSEVPPTYSAERWQPQQSIARYTSRLRYPSSMKPGQPGLQARPVTSPNALGPRSRVPAVNCRGNAPADRANKAAPSLLIGYKARPPRLKAEFPAETSRTPPFTTTQFHVLLNSLFKVLFNLPSPYLFAIGLRVIFRLTRSLPRTLGCTPKQPDSREKSPQPADRLTGLSPSMGSGHCQVGL